MKIAPGSFKEEIYKYIGSPTSPMLHALVGKTAPNPNYKIKRNISDTYSIEYVYSGKGTIQENNLIFNVSAGDFFILHPNKYHHYYANPNNPWTKIWLVINGSTDFPTDLLKAYNIPDQIYFPKINSPLELENIFQLLKNDTPNPDIELERLIFSTIQSLGYSGLTQSIGAHSVVQNIKAYIDRRLNTKINLKKVCEIEFSVSPEYFPARSKKYMGFPRHSISCKKRCFWQKCFLRKQI